MNFSISFSPLFSRIALATGAGMTGACSGSEIAGAAGLGLLTVTAGVTTYLLGRQEWRRRLTSAAPMPQAPEPVVARPAPVAWQRTIHLGGDPREFRGLVGRVRFWTPYQVEVDLRGVESDQVLRVAGRRPHNGFTADGLKVPVLELCDPYVSLEHASVRCEYDRKRQRWTLEVYDHSTNGTQIAGEGSVNGTSRRIVAERSDLTLTVGCTQVRFVLSNPAAPVARPLAPPATPPPAPPVVASPEAAPRRMPERPKIVTEDALMPLAQIEAMVAQALPLDRRVRVLPSDTQGVRIEVRHSDSLRPAILLMHFPRGTGAETLKRVAEFLNTHCRLFPHQSEPTMSVAVEFYSMVPSGRVITLSGSSAAQTIAPGSDGVGGTLKREDLRNRNGLPRAHIALQLPEPTMGEGQALGAVAQIEDAFLRIRRALDAVNAPLEEIDPIASIFAVREG